MTTPHESAPIRRVSMTPHARAQMDERGFTEADVRACIDDPLVERRRSANATARWNDRLGVFINLRTDTVHSVMRLGEIEQIMAAVATMPTLVPERRREYRPRPAPSVPAQRMTVTNVLDSVHPALRASITRQVDGDFSRLVIHSPTRVSIKPLT